jgi:hypothetical protein
MASLNGLQYEPTPWEVERGRIARAFSVLFLSVAEVAAIWGLGLYLVNHSWDVGSAFVAFLLVVISVSVILLGRRFVAERATRIVNGAMRLPFPVKTRRGRVREIPLGSIEDVTPKSVPGMPHGIFVQLQDGSRFYLPSSAFGNGGMRVLESLSAVFGKSFLGEIKRNCFEGSRWRFQRAYPHSLAGSDLVLTRPIRTYTRSSYLLGNEIRSVNPGLVDEIEPVSPAYAGPSLLVTLSDGSCFLVSNSDADRLKLFDNESWRAKLKDHPGDWLRDDPD